MAEASVSSVDTGGLTCPRNCCRDYKEPSSSFVRLNVGGMLYATTAETLTHREPDSMLAVMFSGRHHIHVDPKEGSIFIDRDGTHFRHILNWLRDGVVPERLEGCTVEELRREAEYFQMRGLVEALEAMLTKPMRTEEEEDAELTRTDVVKMLCSKRVRLRGVNISGVNLSKLDLSAVDFGSGRLYNTFFSQAILQGAQFREAMADGANFHKCNMKECDLMGASLRGVLMSGACLQSANMQDACLAGASLCGADLRSAHLQNADLSNANLSGANLEGANLKNAQLVGANLKGAKLMRAYLRDVDLRNAVLEGANVEGANMSGVLRT